VSLRPLRPRAMDTRAVRVFVSVFVSVRVRVSSCPRHVFVSASRVFVSASCLRVRVMRPAPQLPGKMVIEQLDVAIAMHTPHLCEPP
jgi:hypothetical protein